MKKVKVIGIVFNFERSTVRKSDYEFYKCNNCGWTFNLQCRDFCNAEEMERMTDPLFLFKYLEAHQNLCKQKIKKELKKNQAVLHGVPFNFEYIPPKGDWPPFKKDLENESDPNEYYKCYDCGWLHSRRMCGSFDVSNVPEFGGYDEKLIKTLDFHQTRCKPGKK